MASTVKFLWIPVKMQQIQINFRLDDGISFKNHLNFIYHDPVTNYSVLE